MKKVYAVSALIPLLFACVSPEVRQQKAAAEKVAAEAVQATLPEMEALYRKGCGAFLNEIPFEQIKGTLADDGYSAGVLFKPNLFDEYQTLSNSDESVQIQLQTKSGWGTYKCVVIAKSPEETLSGDSKKSLRKAANAAVRAFGTEFAASRGEELKKEPIADIYYIGILIGPKFQFQTPPQTRSVAMMAMRNESRSTTE